jgi:thiamine biosynthesis lipoprotein
MSSWRAAAIGVRRPADRRYVHVAHVMGTVVSFDVRGLPDRGAAEAVASAVRGLRRVDEVFSTYRPDSAISRIGRGELAPDQAGPEVAWVLDRCARLRRETRGYFDIGAGGGLDPSALVKGWAAQRAADELARAGCTDFCLAAGGDVVCRGDRSPGLPWRIGIQHPYDRTALAAVVAAHRIAVATSGAYERGAHIIDPHTGRPARSVVSVTVTGPDLGTADAYSTAAFAMGADGPAWLLGLTGGYEGMVILADGTVSTTPRFPLAEPEVAPEAEADSAPVAPAVSDPVPGVS